MFTAEFLWWEEAAAAKSRAPLQMTASALSRRRRFAFQDMTMRPRGGVHAR